MRLRRPLPAVQGDTLHIVGVGDNRIGKEDTSPGIHDTLIAACDDYRYGLLGCKEYHENCTDNLFAADAAIGHKAI